MVTNPTHLAVALKFDAREMIAPRVLAKGSGHVAQRIRKIAAQHHCNDPDPNIDQNPGRRKNSQELFTHPLHQGFQVIGNGQQDQAGPEDNPALEPAARRKIPMGHNVKGIDLDKGNQDTAYGFYDGIRGDPVFVHVFKLFANPDPGAGVFDMENHPCGYMAEILVLFGPKIPEQ